MQKKFGGQPHGNLKGLTKTEKYHDKKYNHTIYILSGLPKIEFEAVLAHELLHIWLSENEQQLMSEKIEGFCNLGSSIIYENDGTHFSKIHLQSMKNDSHPIYGDGYRYMKSQLEMLGWKKLIEQLHSIK